MEPTSKPNTKAASKASGTSTYLLLYNLLSFTLWAILTVRMVLLVALLAPAGHTAAIYDALSQLLLITQTLATLEIFHSLFRLVRASVVTTGMQVASRLLVVWFVMYLFSENAIGAGRGVVGGGEVSGRGKLVGEGGKWGDWAFVGCLSAWGVTECIRYGFFVLQLSGFGVPGWVSWLRYNTFFVLYPLGISCECSLIYMAIAPARDIYPLLSWFFRAVLLIYVPGSYILYTHMMAQRRKMMRAGKKSE